MKGFADQSTVSSTSPPADGGKGDAQLIRRGMPDVEQVKQTCPEAADTP